MKVLLCHNYYQQPGGEDQSFASEAALLESRGNEVIRYTLHNDAIDGMGRASVAIGVFYNRRAARELRDVMRRERPDVMHCTNTFPLISPAAYYAARAEKVPVVQSLRNYRQLCPSALLLRDGKVCEDCLTKLFAWPGVMRGCYRGSRAASAVVAGMSALHHLAGTWRRMVDRYFTLTQFSRQKFLEAGWPAERLDVKPNFVYPDPGLGVGHGDYAIFVGRLSAEKGLQTLLDAWRLLPSDWRLKIVGQGPLAGEAQQFASEHPQVELAGHLPIADVLDLIGNARLLVMPSIWYETFGRTIIEAFAKGTPVVASHLGAMAELVEDGVTGRLFTPGDPADLAEKIREVWSAPDLDRWRCAARDTFERKYTADVNYELLTGIYQRAIQARASLGTTS